MSFANLAALKTHIDSGNHIKADVQLTEALRVIVNAVSELEQKERERERKTTIADPSGRV